jgi:hypothetical protein
MTLLAITVVSMLIAVVMSAVAWRAAADERLRSAVRVTMLAEEIHGVTSDEFPAGPVLLRAAQPTATPSRLGVALTIGAFVVSAGVTLSVALTIEARNARAASTHAADSVPLDLVALGHEREGDRLIVRGVVRNPLSHPALSHLTAVVFVFRRDGGFLASGRAPIETSVLGPGVRSIFVVTIPGVGGAERYRVSFRTDGRIVPHVDQRMGAP